MSSLLAVGAGSEAAALNFHGRSRPRILYAILTPNVAEKANA